MSVGASGRLFIDLDAIRYNYRALCRHVAPALCGAVIKADGYGLGASVVAPVLEAEGCRDFFVAHLSEALAMGDCLNRTSRVFVLNGPPPGAEHVLSEHGFIPILSSLDQTRRWALQGRQMGRVLAAGLQLDTGMTRLGVLHEDAVAISRSPDMHDWITFKVVMSHLACADFSSDPANRQQLERFCATARLFPGVPRSLANSGGAMLGPDFHQSIVRAGLALFGSVASDQAGLAIKPVVRLQARVLQIHSPSDTVGVGYGLTHRTAGPARLATLGVGYGDGWPRATSNRGAAWLGDQRLPVVGRVSMDSMTVDLSGIPDERIGEGDWVDLIGPRQSLEDVARDAQTISYEILTRLGRRYQRVLLGDRAQGAIA